MPLINGMKMACEPCIRGHRSTKCTHANERLMVPVKKPGRPLSACPHLHNQLCGCSSVTAAIPRKQKCHCGTGASSGPALAVQPRPVLSAIPDIPSPTKVTFRVQKPPLSSRPGSRKQSYDLSNLERMDASNVNIISYHTATTQPAVGQGVSNGHSMTDTNGSYADGSQRPPSNEGPQNSMLQSRYIDVLFPPGHTEEEYIGGYPASKSANFTSNGPYLQIKSNLESSLKYVKATSGASCCGSKSESSNGGRTFEPKPFGKTDSEIRSGLPGVPLIPSEVTSEIQIVSRQPGTQQYLFSDDFSNTQEFYSSFVPQTTIYEYPASYGSYQQPLQPLQWRRDFRSNIYAQSTLQPEMICGPTALTSDTISSPKTQHSCGCGDTCQCIGCVAHPYNAATRNCVLSAYSMSYESSVPESSELSNGHTNGAPLSSASDPPTNGNGHTNSASDELSPPNGDSPSDTSTVEEQTLPASDFLFVNYPFSSDDCGGDTNSCPCGDECECIGCMVHRFDESSMAIASESWVNDQIFTNGDDSGLLNGVSIKDENLTVGFDDEPKRSCCG